MRCAIYTRKSSEEGLAQEFNSLDAQRESAEAYILSQRHAGWTALAERYDDGGYSGANLERPALQRLLLDIEAGRIDCVMVYKVDRLSRSLLDFARLMGLFDKRGVNLVSVTQQFNTTTSLGRLTLNILLSFAQFEREIIGERTHDKMSAARRKGKWVGGTPVLGYDVAPGGGRLVIHEEEAQQVREIFALYVKHRDLNAVLDEVQERQWMTKRWTSKKGKLHPGRPFSRQTVLRLLTNVLYAGKVHYHGEIYVGEHSAIVAEGTWEKVQSLLESSGCSEPRRVRRRVPPTLDDEAKARSQDTSRPEAEQPNVRLPNASATAPRITRLLALALKFEGLLHEGVVKDYAELARIGRVSRARVTQIMNLLSLAPDIQEQILSWAGEASPASRSLRESSVRALSAEVIWRRQRERWKRWSTLPDHQQSETATAS